MPVNPLIQSLLSLLKTDGVTKEEVYQNVIELFPQLCGAKKDRFMIICSQMDRKQKRDTAIAAASLIRMSV